MELAELLENPARAADLSPPEARDLLLRLSALQSPLAQAALAVEEKPTQQYLSVKEAAAMLGFSASALYHAPPGKFPFMVRIGPRPRCSLALLEKYLKERGK